MALSCFQQQHYLTKETIRFPNYKKLFEDPGLKAKDCQWMLLVAYICWLSPRWCRCIRCRPRIPDSKSPDNFNTSISALYHNSDTNPPVTYTTIILKLSNLEQQGAKRSQQCETFIVCEANSVKPSQFGFPCQRIETIRKLHELYMPIVRTGMRLSTHLICVSKVVTLFFSNTILQENNHLERSFEIGRSQSR